MAEEFVRKEHFDEYALRMDERFLGIENRMDRVLPTLQRSGSRTLLI